MGNWIPFSNNVLRWGWAIVIAVAVTFPIMFVVAIVVGGWLLDFYYPGPRIGEDDLGYGLLAIGIFLGVALVEFPLGIWLVYRLSRFMFGFFGGISRGK